MFGEGGGCSLVLCFRGGVCAEGPAVTSFLGWDGASRLGQCACGKCSPFPRDPRLVEEVLAAPRILKQVEVLSSILKFMVVIFGNL